MARADILADAFTGSDIPAGAVITDRAAAAIARILWQAAERELNQEAGEANAREGDQAQDQQEARQE